jgi:hypothetical protein
MEGSSEAANLEAQPKLTLAQRFCNLSWQEWAFALGLVLYLATRLIQLDKFPIYFFTDEAIQTMSAVDLLARGLRDVNGRLLPTYFENGGQYNLSLSVYLQLMPALLPRSVFLTRAVPAVISLVVPLTMGLALRDFFKARLWWAAPVFLAAVPTWFLHSRTAFETSLGVSMFSLFLYFYLCYRLKNRHYLPLAFLFGALAFYAYSPMQLVVVLTGVVLLGVDWRYHWADRKGLLRGLAVLVLLAAPYVRFRLQYPEALGQHLTQLQSYWVSSQTLGAKIGDFLRRYVHGFDPTYWFLPNSSDLIRHQMKGLGHMRLISLPFVLLGLGAAVSRLKDPAWRVVLIALLTAPAGAALVDVAITRLLVMILPLSYLALLGMEQVVAWLIQKHSQLVARWVGVGLVLLWAVLAGTMTVDGLKNGPTWYEDYGLYGMQWGGETLFDEIKCFMQDHPEKEIHLSPSWANGTDVIARFFLGDPLPIQMGTIEPYTLYQMPLNKDIVFVMTPEEYSWMLTTNKFTDVEVLQCLLYPNGECGFYFVTLRYVDNVAEIFAREQAERREPKQAEVELLGQSVSVEYSPLDIGSIAQVFDGDPKTFIRTFEANPLEITLSFSQPVELRGVSMLIGNAASRLEVEVTQPDSQTPLEFSAEIGPQQAYRTLGVSFGKTLQVQSLYLRLYDLDQSEPGHVHLWEVNLQ